eukprot:SAG11_NODE_3224_length_2600_cov_3.746901_4_plen_69_part_00
MEGEGGDELMDATRLGLQLVAAWLDERKWIGPDGDVGWEDVWPSVRVVGHALRPDGWGGGGSVDGAPW